MFAVLRNACKPLLKITAALSKQTPDRLLIVGQAPGTKVHASGIPWDDASGRRLRDWLEMLWRCLSRRTPLI